MRNLPIHTSTDGNACGTPRQGSKLDLNDVLVRWLGDVDAGKFKYPHALVDGLILTRIGSIWEHCLLQEWFIDTAMVTSRIDFKRYLVDHGIAGGKTFEKTIDRVRHTGFVSVQRCAIKPIKTEKCDCVSYCGDDPAIPRGEVTPCRTYQNWIKSRARAADLASVDALLAQHHALRQDNEHCYFELAYTRITGWMAYICDKPAGGTIGTPEFGAGRTIITRGQGDTPGEACANALMVLGAPA